MASCDCKHVRAIPALAIQDTPATLFQCHIKRFQCHIKPMSHQINVKKCRATLRTEAHSKHVRHGANLDLPKIIANLSREKDFGTATLSIDRVTTYSLTLWVRNGWGWA